MSENSIFCELKEKLAASWPSPIVARTDVGRFSGGLLHHRTMANRDALGTGPKKVKVGRKVAYDRDGLIEWMEKQDPHIEEQLLSKHIMAQVLRESEQKAAAQKAWDDWHDCIGAVTDEDDDYVPTMSIQWETAFRAGVRWALEQVGDE